MPAPEWLTARPVAHRGLHDAARGVLENTLPAAEAAVAGGLAIEVDIQPSADGVAMVFHDETLDRLTEGQGPVSTVSAAMLQGLRFRHSDTRIPTLDDLLDFVAGRVPLLIEIKSEGRTDRGLEARIVERLKHYQGPVALMSLDPDSIAAVAALAPEMPRGIVAMRYDDAASRRDMPPLRRFSLRHLLHVPQTRPHFIAYHVRGLPTAGPLLVKRVLGLPLLTWTVRTAKDRAVAARYADQIIFEGFDPRDLPEDAEHLA